MYRDFTGLDVSVCETALVYEALFRSVELLSDPCWNTAGFLCSRRISPPLESLSLVCLPLYVNFRLCLGLVVDLAQELSEDFD